MDNFEWPDMPIAKAPKNNQNLYDDYGKSHFTTENIYEYLKFCHKNGLHKLAGIITNKQRLFNIARGSDHWGLTQQITDKIFPKRGYNWNHQYNDGIAVYSVGDDLTIYLPDRISQIQYESLLQIIKQVHQFEKDYDTKVNYFNAEYTLEEVKKRLTSSKANDSDEVIVGIPLTEELPNELFEETESNDKVDWPTWDDEVQINEYVEVDNNDEVHEFAEVNEKQNQENNSKIHFS